MSHARLRVEDASQVAEARRRATTMAHMLGFDETRAGAVALAVTEAATNLVRHAGRGEILAGPVERGQARGLEFYVIDAGPGIADVAASLRDGESSAGSAGLGLGSLNRMTTGFELYTERGKGTVMHFSVFPDERAAASAPAPSHAALCVPKSGEEVSGDGWLVSASRGRTIVLVADGLGHGPDAAAASSAARRFVSAHAQEPAAALVEGMHHALKSTRGAAAAVAVLDGPRGVGEYCGVGNIACTVRVKGASRSLVSHNGTLGHHVHKIQPFQFPFPRGALLVACSDGIGTRWDLGTYPGLAQRSPALVAGVIYRDHQRGRDDATVVALRNEAD